MVEGVEGIFESPSTHNRLIEKQLTYRWNEWMQKKAIYQEFRIVQESANSSFIRLFESDVKIIRIWNTRPNKNRQKATSTFLLKTKKNVHFYPVIFFYLK